MPEFRRLVCTVALGTEQSLATKYLMDAEGLCTCGRFLKKTDAKLCLGQINTDYFSDKKYKNTLVIAAYCFDCSNRINDVLKYLKGSNQTVEPDRVRQEGHAPGH